VRIERIAAGDIVLCSIGGRRIYGEVSEITDGVVHFRPITAAAGWRHAGPRQIIAHWRKTGRPRSAAEVPVAGGDDESPPPPREQLSLPIHT
jgi:translation initiation factor 2 gamma subunit (eIF-2gamma)